MEIKDLIEKLEYLANNCILADTPHESTLRLASVKLKGLQAVIDNWCKEEDVYYSVKCIPPDHVKSLFALRSDSTIDPGDIPIFSRNDIDKGLRRVCKLSY